MDKSKYEVEEVVFSKCPICKKGKVEKLMPKGFFSFAKSTKIICNDCSAQFSDEGEYQEESVYKLDLSESKEKNKYDGEALKKSEWERGISDLDLCVKTNSLPKANVVGLKIILKPGEQSHWYSSSRLMEERAIRRSHGGAVRIMKGVYVGGSQSESHGELRAIDNGSLLLTNQRLIFNGGFKNIEYQLSKIVSIEEYKDAVEIGSSNRQKVQLYVVEEPHKWAIFVRIAVQIAHSGGKKSKNIGYDESKPEWLEQEEKNKDMFHSDEGLSPINVLREKAKDYQKNKEFKKAEELYKKIAEMSKMGFDFCAYGDILYKQDKFLEAIKAYKEAIRLEPDAPYPKNAIEKVKRKQESKKKG